MNGRLLLLLLLTSLTSFQKMVSGNHFFFSEPGLLVCRKGERGE